MIRSRGYLAIIGLLTLVTTTAVAALFEDDAIIDVELVGPLATLLSDTDAREQLPFILRAEGVDHEIKVRVRGKSRLRVCKLPPLRLNFKKGETGDTVFAGQDKLKLVVPCHLSDRAEKDLLEEYAAYRIFNLLSDASYRVRLLHVRFVDSDGRSYDENRHAFLIEPKDELAERLAGIESDLPEIALSWLDQRQLALMYVFQYMVGNTDWSFVRPYEEAACCHNGTLIETDAITFYVPYDFDLTGLVNAPYARPAQETRLSRVTERQYRGFCMDKVILRDALRTVRDREEDIYAIIADLPVLSESDKQRRSKYLGAFFKAAQNEDKLLRKFERRCKR